MVITTSGKLIEFASSTGHSLIGGGIRDEVLMRLYLGKFVYAQFILLKTAVSVVIDVRDCNTILCPINAKTMQKLNLTLL